MRYALAELKERAAQQLFERIGSRINDSTLTEEKLHAYARAELLQIVTRGAGSAEFRGADSASSRRSAPTCSASVRSRLLLDDPTITEIMVNGPDQIYVERDGPARARATSRFTSEAHLRRVIERIVSKVGRRIDESSPLVDARLPDGSRVNAIIPPLAVNGSSLTIRKFAREPLHGHRPGRFGTLTQDMADLLEACVQARLNIIVSGGTGTGKTTLLNVLARFIPDGRAHRRRSRTPSSCSCSRSTWCGSSRGRRTSRARARSPSAISCATPCACGPTASWSASAAAARALDMLQAMNTGHDGSLSTVHANSPRDAIARLETLVLMAGMDLPLRAVREQIASAIDLIVQVSRLRDGSRRVTHVTEVQGMEGDIVTLQDAFVFDYAAGVDDDGRFLGHAIATGVRPRFADRFHDLGIPLSPASSGSHSTTRSRR